MKIVERENAEEKHVPAVLIWAYGEESYDCHPMWMVSYRANFRLNLRADIHVSPI